MSEEQAAHLRFLRRHIPEPTRCPDAVIRFLWPPEAPLAYHFGGDLGFEPASEVGAIERKLFTSEGTRFWAWTFDGVTPLFPEYD